jgi:hypothetical protein
MMIFNKLFLDLAVAAAMIKTSRRCEALGVFFY